MTTYSIIGGGIGGLYCAWNLIHKGCDASSITIFEKNMRLGGCIHTWEGKELGAGRFMDEQKMIIALIRELDLTSKMSAILENNKDFKHKMFRVSPPSLKVLKKKIDQEKMEKMSFYSWASEFLTTQDIRYLIYSSGYTEDYERLNAWNWWKTHSETFSSDYRVMRGGLSQIIDKLESKLEKKGVKIHKDIEVTDVLKEGDSLSLKFSGNRKSTKTDIVILALPKNALMKFSLLRDLDILKSVNSQPLMRIYANIKGLKGVNGKITTDNLLRYIIPLEKDLYMISYTDGRFADYWKEIISCGNQYFKSRIRGCLERMGYNPGKISNLTSRYWEDCVHLWKPGYSSEKVGKSIVKPLEGCNLYICSESYSTHQGWMEGSLEAVHAVIDRINPTSSGFGKKPKKTSAQRTKPALWKRVVEEVKRGGKGGRPGQWSARKAQLAVHLYKKRGGGYRGRKRSSNSLAKWTREDWGTRSGRSSVVGSKASGERYLPKRARKALTRAEYKKTSDKKRSDITKGKQYSKQSGRIAKKTSRYRS